MKKSSGHVVVLSTAPNLKSARQLARLALAGRLVACANLVPGIESHYWWAGKMETSREILLIMKTLRRTLPALEKLWRTEHPYATPELVALEMEAGGADYLEWIHAAVTGGGLNQNATTSSAFA
jgi:periplasmic divalent cation tolerance protein